MQFLLVFAGIVLFALALTLDLLTGRAYSFGQVNTVEVSLGSLFLVVGLAMPRARYAALLAKLSLLVLVLVLFVGAAEATCLVLDVDFARGEEAFRAHPIYYRSATVPVGEFSYRRPGPQTWTGKVFTTEMRLRGIDRIIFPDERELTITYDADGFRNPPDLREWDVVVAGDSFVESGYLPYEELLTTRLAGKLGKPVRNLGICNTGTLSQVAYLREFGKSEGTRHAVLAFFEGNDIVDIGRESGTRERVRREGKHEPLDIGRKQTSFIQAIKDWRRSLKKKNHMENARLDTGEQVTLRYAPPASKDLDEEEVARLEGALTDWADTARDLGLTPWLLYLPCKHRVVHGRVEPYETAQDFILAWRPNDLPAYVEALCRERGIRYLDATPALRASFENGRLPYNPIWDSHLNSHGSEVVATVLAAGLR